MKTLTAKIAGGDSVFLYVKAPVSGVVGIGKVRGSVFKGDKPLWPDEVHSNKIIYLHRFAFEAVNALEEDQWTRRAVKLIDLSLSLKIYSAVNPIPESAARQIRRETQKWNNPITAPTADHDKIKDMLVDIGTLQGWIPAGEYRLENFRLDVVWRRVKRGSPHVAFEVQIGGNLIEALSKLKHAFDMWNSIPILVTDDEQLEKAVNLCEGSFHEIRDRLRIMDWRKIYELHETKRKVNALELELGVPIVGLLSRTGEGG